MVVKCGHLLFGNKVLGKIYGYKKDEAERQFILLHNEELCYVYRLCEGVSRSFQTESI